MCDGTIKWNERNKATVHLKDSGYTATMLWSSKEKGISEPYMQNTQFFCSV